MTPRPPIRRFACLAFLTLASGTLHPPVALAAGESAEAAAEEMTRPHQPWVFRCVLDRRARSVVVALSDDVWAAWDAQTCDLYKVWSGEAAGPGTGGGGMKFTGTVYDTSHGPQPQSLGETFDTFEASSWTVLRNGEPLALTPRWLGHVVDGDRSVTFTLELRLEDGGVVTVHETPEAAGPRALRRTFRVEGLPAGAVLRNQLANGVDATAEASGGVVLEADRGQRILLFRIDADADADGDASATVTWPVSPPEERAR